MDNGAVVSIMLFLIIGVVLVVYFYFRSKDRQLIIEKGVSPEMTQNMFRYKFSPYIWFRIGIVIACGSLGILVGNYLMYAFPIIHYAGYAKNPYYYTEVNPAMMIFSIFFGIGVGFILAFYLSRRMEEKDDEKRNKIRQ